MPARTILTIFLITFSFIESAAQTLDFNPDTDQVKYVFDWKIKHGDNADWSQTEFDHSEWDNLISDDVFSPDTGITWMKAKLNILTEEKDGDRLALRIASTLPAYQIYWDGELVKENGRVSSQESEQQFGKIVQVIILNDEQLTPGEHTIGVRFSNYTLYSKYFLSVFFGYITIINSEVSEFYVEKALLAGMYFITALLCIALFWGGDKHRGLLIFALICLLYMINIGFNPLIEYIDANTSIYSLLNQTYLVDYYLSWFLILTFFVFNYSIPNKALHIGIYAIIVLTRIIIPGNSEFLISFRGVTLTLYPIGILIYAVWQKRPGGWAALLAFVSFTSPNVTQLLGLGIQLFDSLLPDIFFMFFIILSISTQIRDKNLKSREVVRLKYRLEQELLKKNIQPHFLMNTLHSIKSFIDEDSKKATELIHALADEFHLIINLLDKSEISFKEEIELCKYHLKIMGFRRDSEFELIVNNGRDEDIVPPLIFHTLIENGITHAFKVNENGIFKLTRIQDGTARKYRLTNNGTLIKDFEKLSDPEIEEGMGIKYIKARLEEAYPGKWQFSYGVHDSKWVVDIEIKGT